MIKYKMKLFYNNRKQWFISVNASDGIKFRKYKVLYYKMNRNQEKCY